MTKRNQNVRVYRGNTATIVVDVTQADGTEYDPTINAQFYYRVALTSHSTDNEAMIRKSLSDGIASDGQGNVTITLKPEDTDFVPGVYYHELKVVDGDDVSSAMVGAFVIKKAIPIGEKVIPLHGNAALSATTPTRTP